MDPLANLNLSEADFGWATRKIMEVADLRSAGKVISVLEGGYAVQSLAPSAAAHVTALMES
jgi:acetoin utilization deacetylase AcuC-like enzyme